MNPTYQVALSSLHEQVERTNQNEYLLPFDQEVVEECEQVLAQLSSHNMPAPQVWIAEDDPITIDFVWISEADRGLCAFYNGGRIELKWAQADEDTPPPTQVDSWQDAVDVILSWGLGATTQPDDH